MVATRRARARKRPAMSLEDAMAAAVWIYVVVREGVWCVYGRRGDGQAACGSRCFFLNGLIRLKLINCIENQEKILKSKLVLLAWLDLNLHRKNVHACVVSFLPLLEFNMCLSLFN